MKKILGILLAVMMMATTLIVGTSALAESDAFPQPEGGRKFETRWAAGGADISIDYEEEGYRVAMLFFKPGQTNGTEFAYNCYYHENEDALVSVSSSRTDFTFDPETYVRVYAPATYEGFDEDGQETVFTINEKGNLVWKDGHGNEGEGLEFYKIGTFQGEYENKTDKAFVEIDWNGLDPETPFYTVFVRMTETLDLQMTGIYNPETGKLECSGSTFTWVPNDIGGYEPSEESEPCEATFSFNGNGHLVYENNGMEFETVDYNVSDFEF
ncbi:MAG: hypothetical protein IJL88_00895 [Clostridia bacterium]|nr:hypothetical protein [Clostridia bacterium]